MTGSSRWDQSVYPRSRNMCQHPWVSELCNRMSFVDSNLDDKTGHDHWHVTIDLSKGRNGKSNSYTAGTTLSHRLCNSRCYLSVHKTHPQRNLFLKSELPSTRFYRFTANTGRRFVAANIIWRIPFMWGFIVTYKDKHVCELVKNLYLHFCNTISRFSPR